MKKYPKTLYIRQVNNVASDTVNKECARTFTKIVNNRKEEIEFKSQAYNMEPNFTNMIQDTPFIKT